MKEVNEVRKRKSLRVPSVRKSVGEELTRGNDAEVGWRKYFVQLLNGGEINEVGGGVKRERGLD